MPEPAWEILGWISDAAFVLDPGGRLLYVNRQAAEFAGRPASRLIGRTVCEIFPEEWSPGFCACAQAALKEQAPVASGGSARPLVPGSTRPCIPVGGGCSPCCVM